MANIELRERFFGNGLVGRIDLRQEIETLSRSPQPIHLSERDGELLAGLGAMVDRLGWELDSVRAAISSLEQNVSVRLDEQTKVMEKQLEVLLSIDAALRSPAKIRAAERLSDAAKLLRAGRHQRALSCALEAIDGDPNNPSGFAAAAWATFNLGQPLKAVEWFLEARAAATDHRKSDYSREAARCLLVAEEAPRARRVLETAIATRGVSTASAARSQYLLAIAAAEDGDVEAACAALLAAVEVDSGFAAMAAIEPSFRRYPSLAARAMGRAEVKSRELDASKLLAHLNREPASSWSNDPDHAQALSAIAAAQRLLAQDTPALEAAVSALDEAEMAVARLRKTIEADRQERERLRLEAAEREAAAAEENRQRQIAQVAAERLARDKARIRALENALLHLTSVGARVVKRSTFDAVLVREGIWSGTEWTLQVDEQAAVSTTRRKTEGTVPRWFLVASGIVSSAAILWAVSTTAFWVVLTVAVIGAVIAFFNM
jgi:hypothetical protein